MHPQAMKEFAYSAFISKIMSCVSIERSFCFNQGTEKLKSSMKLETRSFDSFFLKSLNRIYLKTWHEHILERQGVLSTEAWGYSKIQFEILVRLMKLGLHFNHFIYWLIANLLSFYNARHRSMWWMKMIHSMILIFNFTNCVNSRLHQFAMFRASSTQGHSLLDERRFLSPFTV